MKIRVILALVVPLFLYENCGVGFTPLMQRSKFASNSSVNYEKSAVIRLSRQHYLNILEDTIGFDSGHQKWNEFNTALNEMNIHTVPKVDKFENSAVAKVPADEFEKLLKLSEIMTEILLGSPLMQNCGSTCVETAASTLWRREPNTNEVSKIAAIKNRALSADDANKYGLLYVVLSPAFHYNIPAGDKPSDEDVISKIIEKFAFAILGSIPNNRLESIKQKYINALPNFSSDEFYKELEGEVHTILSDRKYAERLSKNFAGNWLGYAGMNNNDAIFSGLTKKHAYKESHYVLTELIFNNRPVSELLKPGFTYVDNKLAQHYGLDSYSGSGWQAVLDKNYGGILSQLNFHFSSNKEDNDKYPNTIRRSLAVARNLMCINFIFSPDAASPEEILALVEQQEVEDLNNVEFLDRLKDNKSCGGCHGSINPLAIGVELFNPLGQYRTTYPSGDTISFSQEIKGRTYNDLSSYLDVIGNDSQFHSCFQKQFNDYITGVRAFDQNNAYVESDESLGIVDLFAKLTVKHVCGAMCE